MFEQYVKLFNLNWIEPWLIEAVAYTFGAMLLVFVICKALDCMNGGDR